MMKMAVFLKVAPINPWPNPRFEGRKSAQPLSFTLCISRNPMTQKLADSLQLEFLQITGIKVDARFFPKGPLHQPSALPNGKQGVYVFLTEDHCFKVGKAGPKSKARWNSHHYCLDETTPSAFTKSIIKNKERFKSYFSESQRSEIKQLAKDNIGIWIKNNISRIELLLPQNEGGYALNLLEALVQYRLNPKYEGKNA